MFRRVQTSVVTSDADATQRVGDVNWMNVFRLHFPLAGTYYESTHTQATLKESVKNEFKNLRHKRGYKTFTRDKIGMIHAANTDVPRGSQCIHASQKCRLLSAVLANWP